MSSSNSVPPNQPIPSPSDHATPLQTVQDLNLEAVRKLYLDAQKKLDWYESYRSPSAKVRLSEKIPDVTPFQGTRLDIDSFLTRLRLKLNGNADRYPTESSKVQYAVGRLAGRAEQLMQLHIDRDTGAIEFQTLREFTDWILSEFEDPDKMRNAQVEIQALRQRNRDFSTYYSEFAPLMLKTGFNDEGKTAALMNGISRELRAAMVIRDIPSTFTELIKDLRKVDERLRANDTFNSRTASSNFVKNSPSPQQQQPPRPLRAAMLTRNAPSTFTDRTAPSNSVKSFPRPQQQKQRCASPNDPSRPAVVTPVTLALSSVKSGNGRTLNIVAFKGYLTFEYPQTF